MSERELKLHVPAKSRKAMERDVRQGGSAQLVRLHAMYFDTPHRALAKARIALRLRREGNAWVQTLKMPGEDAISRMELNHPRPGPILDLSVYADTPAEPHLLEAGGQLGLRYETDIKRLVRKLRTRQGTVELSYDVGLVRAGDMELPICEAEFELMSGKLAAIFTAARTWQKRHGLVLDFRSKSERGDALARLAQQLAHAPGAAQGPGYGPSQASAEETQHDAAERSKLIMGFWEVRGSRGVTLKPEMNPAQALAAVSAECLDQIVRNAAMLAEVDTDGILRAGNPDHVHQLRVGMRRLRSALKLFDGWAQPPLQPLQDAMRAHFTAFGANRDQDVLRDSIIPTLEKAGMPVFPAPEAGQEAGADSCEIARGLPFQSFLLDMLEWSLDVQPVTAPGPAGIAHVPAARAVNAAHAARAANAAHAAHPADPGRAAAPVLDAGLPNGHDIPSTVVQADDADSADAGAESYGIVVPTIIPLGSEDPEPTLRHLLARRLRKWHRRIVAGGLQFATLDMEARHTLRKRGKRLRYGIEFASALFPGSKVREYRQRLSKVQDTLGELNDLVVARELYEHWANRHPQAWFALGWFSARQESLVAQAGLAFGELKRAPPFWK
jgi:inorganic triphosphatase YgiF